MKAIDRFALIDRIGRELQSRMRFDDIDTFLKAKGVDTSKPTSGVNSKWVYTKELLDGESDELVIDIANELDLPHTHAVTSSTGTIEATFWEPHHFRLFLSHLSTFKRTAGALQRALRAFGISTFVAHVDIEPTREWQDEIEAGLFTMDAMAAILMPGFKESNWTDQEVGVAVGRGVLVVPIIRGLYPYGFIAKYQGLHADQKTVGQVAHEIFHILAKSPNTRASMLTALVDTTLQATSDEDAHRKIRHLNSVPELPDTYLERLRDGASGSAVLEQGAARDALNSLLNARGLPPIEVPDVHEFPVEEDLPF